MEQLPSIFSCTVGPAWAGIEHDHSALVQCTGNVVVVTEGVHERC